MEGVSSSSEEGENTTNYRITNSPILQTAENTSTGDPDFTKTRMMSCPLTNYDNKHTDEKSMLMENVISDKIRNISTSKNTATNCAIKSNSGVSEISQLQH